MRNVGFDPVSFAMGRAAGGGGGSDGVIVADGLVYTLQLTDGGKWIETDVELAGIENLLFCNSENGEYTGVCASVAVQNIPQYGGYMSVIINNGYTMNVSKTNGKLMVSFNNPGPSGYATDIYTARAVPPKKA